jgi:ribosomal protein S18 acetylase RimI-like enzyme
MEQIRPATAEDARAIAVIHSEGWRAAYPHIFPSEAFDRRTVDTREQEFREFFAAPGEGHVIWVSEWAGEVVGFAYTRPGADADISNGGELKLFYVAPALKGVGIGGPLFAHAVADLVERGMQPYLYTLQENHAARAWYERRGWWCDGAEVPWALDGAYPEIVEVRYRAPEVD